MYYLAALLCLLLGIIAIAGGRRIPAPQPSQDELSGLARAGLIVAAAFLLIGALVLAFLAVRPGG